MTEDRWGSWWVRRHYSRDGWCDTGEERAVTALRERLTGADVLDLGVGGGRTTTILEPLAGRYLGIDASPGMLRLARRRHPTADLRLGDARDLAGVTDASQDVVMFSNNGIDAVGRAGRPLVLSEVARVLRPGGRFVFSTFNVDGKARHERPGLAALRLPTDRPVFLLPLVVLKRSFDTALGFWHGRRTMSSTEEGDGWAVAPLRPHEYRFAIHFVRLGLAAAELREHGFTLEHVWTPEGEPVAVDAGRTDAEYMNLVARKTASP